MSNDLSSQLRAHLNSSTPEKETPRDAYGKLTHLISSITGQEEPRREDELQDILPDSLSLIELAVRIEQEFSVRIDEQVATSFSTVGDVATYIDTHAEKP